MTLGRSVLRIGDITREVVIDAVSLRAVNPKSNNDNDNNNNNNNQILQNMEEQKKRITKSYMMSTVKRQKIY